MNSLVILIFAMFFIENKNIMVFKLQFWKEKKMDQLT